MSKDITITITEHKQREMVVNTRHVAEWLGIEESIVDGLARTAGSALGDLIAVRLDGMFRQGDMPDGLVAVTDTWFSCHSGSGVRDHGFPQVAEEMPGDVACMPASPWCSYGDEPVDEAAAVYGGRTIPVCYVHDGD